jgi:type 1 fimbria pilin
MAPHALRHEPIYDVVPETDVSIEVFYADRTLETFGRSGAGWFWWPRRIGLSPDGSATGPFATSYAAYRNALGTVLGTANGRDQLSPVKLKG